MKKYSIYLALVLLVQAAGAQAYNFEAIANRHILPAYERLQNHTHALKRSADGYCTMPQAGDIRGLQHAFKNAFLTWQGVQHLRFGPIQYLSREYRIAMWPDKRNSVGKHLSKLLDDANVGQSDFELANKSVAVQGLSALERLIFSEKKPDAKRCRLIRAITSNLQEISGDILVDWKGGEEPFLTFFKAPGAENPIFDNEKTLASTLLNNLYTQLELVQTQKLARPLGASEAKAKGKRTESWRSETSLAAIRENISASRAFYENVFAGELQDLSLRHRIDMGFDKVLVQLALIEKPLHQAVTNPLQRARIEGLITSLSQLKRLIGSELAETLDLSLGFNSLDGD